MEEYYKISIDGSFVVFKNFEDVGATVSAYCEDIEPNEPIDITVEIVEMTQEEYSELPEFEGF